MKKIFLITLLSSTFFLAGCGQNSVSKDVSANEATSKLADCLTQKGYKMYGTDRCPHCQAQKQLFGDDFQKITFIDCDKDKKSCDTAGIEGYPTRIGSDGQRVAGTQSLDQLATLSQCKM